MTTQTFFALFWGWLTVIVIAMFFIRPKALHDVKRLIVDNRAFGLTYGYLSLFLGLASVLLHNEWTLNWHVLITIFGWLALIKGVVVIAWPEISADTRYETRIKSTTIRVLLGLPRADMGTVRLLGGDPWRDAVALHRLGRQRDTRGDHDGGDVLDRVRRGRHRGDVPRQRYRSCSAPSRR